MERGRDKFNRYEHIINIIILFLRAMPVKLRYKAFNIFNKTGGYIGLVLRYALLKTLAKSCGRNVSIHPSVYILNPQNLSIGDNVSIHPMCYIECGIDLKEGVYIGNDVSIAHGVSIIAPTHNYQNMDIPIKDQGTFEKCITISNNVWIGSKATILSGRTIKNGSIIGANSVITKDVNKNEVVGGIPATLIKLRK